MSRAHERTYELLAQRVQLGAQARRVLYVIIGALVLSGGWWLGAHFATAWLGVNEDDIERLAREAIALKIHGAASFLTLLALGAMGASHVRPAWWIRRNRLSGSFVIVAFAVLVLTGYALYYLVSDETRTPVSVVHWALGLALVPMLIIHIVAGRRSRTLDHRCAARRRERK
jgi:hypothetical protein